MSNAPAMPDQTPVNFLRGGAADMFSARCKALLAKAGYEPEDFGDYDHVRKRIKAARDKVKTYNDAKASNTSPLPPKPSKHEEWLAGCQSGHLSQNAIYQRRRGDPCSNLVDGHDDGRYPCMPQQGSATTPGTEHNAVTIDEQDAATAQAGRNPNGAPEPHGRRDNEPPAAANKYPPEQASKDADARTEMLVKRREQEQPTSQGGGQGSTAGGAGSTGGTAGGANGADNGSATKPNDPSKQEITGETAAECINNFRKKGEAAMKQHCQDNVAKNKAAANGGPGVSDQQGAENRKKANEDRAATAAKRDEAEKEMHSANRSRGQYSRADEKAKADLAANPTDPKAIARAQETQQNLANADAKCAQKAAAHEAAQSDAAKAAQKAGTMNNAQCRYEQGVRLAAGNNPPGPPRNDGRIPPEWKDLPRPVTAGGAAGNDPV